MRGTARAGVALLLLSVAGPALRAQTPAPLPLKREQPVVEWQGCPRPDRPPPAPTAEARARAERLAADANEAAILGDNESALELLTEATTLDPRSERAAYLRARTLDLLDRHDEALTEYCRFTALAPDDAEGAEVAGRIAELARARGPAVPAAAAASHAAALRHHDAGRQDDAADAFDAAVATAPEWAAAVFNRGMARVAQDRPADAAADLRRYLELRPGADDFGAVLDLLGRLQAPAQTHNPNAVLAAGLVMPGLGHFTTGRPERGALFLGSAAGMLAAGLMVTTSNVECLSPPVAGRCPPDQVLRETNERPLLLPALVGVVATGVAGAIDAYRGARRQREEATASRTDGAGLSWMPAVGVGTGRAHLTLLRLRF